MYAVQKTKKNMSCPIHHEVEAGDRGHRRGLGTGRSSFAGGSSECAPIRPPLITTSRIMRWPPTASTCAGCADGRPANADEASSIAAVIAVSQILPSIVIFFRV